MQHSLGFLVGDAFIASACVSYYGAFTGEYRAALVTRWYVKFQFKITHCFIKCNVSRRNEIKLQ